MKTSTRLAEENTNCCREYRAKTRWPCQTPRKFWCVPSPSLVCPSITFWPLMNSRNSASSGRVKTFAEISIRPFPQGTLVGAPWFPQADSKKQVQTRAAQSLTIPGSLDSKNNPDRGIEKRLRSCQLGRLVIRMGQFGNVCGPGGSPARK